MTAANTTPRHVDEALLGRVQASTANTNLDGTGAIVDIVTGATHGTQIDRVTGRTTGTGANNMIRFFIKEGGTYYIIHEEAIAAAAGAPSATVKANDFTWDPTDAANMKYFILKSTQTLAVAVHVAETWNVYAFGGSY